MSNNPDSIVILKPFCLNNLIKYLVVFSADLAPIQFIEHYRPELFIKSFNIL